MPRAYPPDGGSVCSPSTNVRSAPTPDRSCSANPFRCSTATDAWFVVVDRYAKDPLHVTRPGAPPDPTAVTDDLALRSLRDVVLGARTTAAA